MIEEEDPFLQIYPDWEQAKRHADAITTGKPKLNKDGTQQICQCCNNTIDREPMKMMQSQKGLVYLGFGIPLYLQFIKFCISITFFLIVTDGMVSVYSAYTTNSVTCSNYYKNNTPTSTTTTIALPFIKLRGSNSTHPSEYQDKMSNLCNNFMIKIATVSYQSSSLISLAQIASFIIHLFFQIYIKIALYQLGKSYNQISIDLDDYTVIVKHLPKQTTGKWKFFTKTANKIMHDSKYSNIPLKKDDTLIYDVVVVPENENIQRNMKQMQEIKNEALQLKQNNPQKYNQALNALKKYKELKFDLIRQGQIVKEKDRQDKLLSQTVFIMFFYQTDRIEFLNSNNQDKLKNELVNQYGKDNVKNVVIQKAPRPKEIIWKGLRTTSRKNFAGSVCKSFFFLFGIFIVFFLLNLLKGYFIITAEADSASTRNASPREKSINQLLGSLVAWLTFISIILFNKYVMGEILYNFTEKQVHESRSDLSYSFAFTYAVGMFFTTSFMTIIIEGLMHGNYYDQSFGVIEQQSYMFLVASIVIPLMWAIHPGQLWHQYKRKKLQGSKSVSQKEANELMADESYKIGQRYAEIVQMMWFSFLYTDLIPAGMFLMLFGMVAFYWVDKYNLLKRSSLQHTYSSKLSDQMAYLIDFTLFWRFLGQIIFQYQLTGSVQIYTCVLLFLALLYIILPIPRIMNLHEQDDDYVPNSRPINMVWNRQFRNINYKSMNDMAEWIYDKQQSRPKYPDKGVQGDQSTYHNNKLRYILDSNYY